jgi:predicted RecB family endonuclease
MSGICHRYIAKSKVTGMRTSAKATNAEDAYEILLEKLGFEITVEEM